MTKILPLVKLSDICRPTQWPTISQSQMTDVGYPVFGANGRIGYYAEYNHEHPTVLITCRGATCGTINISDPKSYVTGNAMALDELDPQTMDYRYVAYALNWRGLRDAITGSAQPQITRTSLSGVEIPLPCLSEQKRIADILDKADTIRRKRQEAIASVEGELLRSAFREQLGDPRTNPKGWPIEQLGNVINFVGGSQPPKETFINEPRPGYVRLVQIRDFKTDKYPTYIPKELARRPFSKDDVMIARYGPPVFQILRGLEGCYNVALMKAENTDRTTKDFIFYLLQIPEIHDVVVANSQRTAGQSGTNLTLLKGLELPIPPIEKQIEIAAILNSIETYHASAQSYCNAAEELFSSLVQRAFKGEL